MAKDRMTQEERNLLTAMRMRSGAHPSQYEAIARVHRLKDECHRDGHPGAEEKESGMMYCSRCDTLYQKE
ncbi:hypothetical protein KY362_06435 [Candidatus Woesearchaeota archaeon]|nr:hypothetical protein [Candidatus Woesearchaeota archaeon]